MVDGRHCFQNAMIMTSHSLSSQVYNVQLYHVHSPSERLLDFGQTYMYKVQEEDCWILDLYKYIYIY